MRRIPGLDLRAFQLVSFCALALVASQPAVAQQILRVPQDIGAIGAAITQIRDGGIVEVAAGTYAAPANGFRVQNPGKSFTVRAAAGARVILDGEGFHTIFRFTNARNQLIVFEGLTFRGGFTQTEGEGGAVTLDRSEVTFVDCSFEANSAAPASTGGGAVRVADESVGVFIDSTFSGNTSPNRGGAMEVTFAKAFVLRGRFEDNRVNLPGHILNSSGGGIHVQDGTLRIWDSYFEGNQAGFTGGGIFAFGTFQEAEKAPAADILIVGTTFVDNRAEADPCCELTVPSVGGAVHVEDQTTLRIVDSEFRLNRAERGGAVDLYRSIVDIRGSAFRGNLATASVEVVATGGAINVNSVDFNDPSTENGSINRRSSLLTVTDSYFEGGFGGVDFPATQGGCIFVAGDVNRQFGEGGVAQDGTLEDNRAKVEIRGSAFVDCDVERPAGAPGGNGFGGAVFLRMADLTLTDSLVVDSDAVGDGTGGGGLALREQSAATVARSTFSGNSAEQAGGAINANGSELTVDDSLFFGNEVSPGVSETVQQSRGASIFSTPLSDAGNPAKSAAMEGTVRGSTFADNTGVPIFEIDLDAGPINAVTYNGNRFFESSFGNTVFINIVAGRTGETVGSLNALIVNRSGAPSTDKSSVANVQLGTRPALATLVAAPTGLRVTGEPGDIGSSFLSFAWNGNAATLDGAALGTRTGFRESSQASNHVLRVNGSVTDSDALESGACSTGPLLCLNGDRFLIETAWEDFQDNTGFGEGVQLTPDTGYFFFFNSTNVELVTKVLDGRPINGNFWLFYGALSNVEYEITALDTGTGRLNTYFNPSRNFASVGDTRAFPSPAVGPPGALVPLGLEFPASPAAAPLLAFPIPSLEVADAVGEGLGAREGRKADCTPSVTNLCLNGGRFRVEIDWEDFQGNTGVGMAEPLTPDTGYFWFFSPTNVEVILKVLDGRPINGNFWVFYGALSNVRYEITVTDTENGNVTTYSNPLRNFASVGDTRALPGN